jgi:hypothetical protein
MPVARVQESYAQRNYAVRLVVVDGAQIAPASARAQLWPGRNAKCRVLD